VGEPSALRVATRVREAIDPCMSGAFAQVNPHNPCLAVFATGTCHVCAFDPRFGADTARLYAGKYAAKPEKHYYLETQRDSVKNFLKCRTIGVCIAHSRLLGFHVVRSTRPCILAVTVFVPERQYVRPREDSHKAKWPLYPYPAVLGLRTCSKLDGAYRARGRLSRVQWVCGRNLCRPCTLDAQASQPLPLQDATILFQDARAASAHAARRALTKNCLLALLPAQHPPGTTSSAIFASSRSSGTSVLQLA
jgi:hypothetical protein